MKPAAKSASATDAVVRDILRGLYEGRYVSGQRLAEPDLTASYGVSRSTVREALKRLEAQGVVELRHHQGARIMSMSHGEAVNTLMVAEMLVGLAARQAAECIDIGTGREDLQKALDEVTRTSEGDRFNFIMARDRFHRALARIAGSRILEQTLANMHVHLVRNIKAVDPKERAASYQRIAEAVFANDPAEAETRGRNHIRVMIELLQHENASAAAPVSGPC